jgi:two-component system NtrC family sensor kinase
VHQRLRPDLAGNAQIAAIDRAVASGAKLTRQLLAFSRRQPMLPERVDLKQRVPELIDLLRPTLGHSIQASCSVAPDTDADRGRSGGARIGDHQSRHQRQRCDARRRSP